MSLSEALRNQIIEEYGGGRFRNENAKRQLPPPPLVSAESIAEWGRAQIQQNVFMAALQEQCRTGVEKLKPMMEQMYNTNTNPQHKEESAMNRFDFIVDGRKYAIQDEAMFLSMERVKKIADVEGSELGMRDKENPTKMKTLGDEDFVFPILDSLATPYVFFTI